MGQLIQKMIDALSNISKDKETRILMLGLDGAGKTTILYKLKLGENISTVPTIGFNVEQVQYKKLQMLIWDIGGQLRLRQLWHHYFQNTNALIFVVDMCDEDRIQEVRENIAYLASNDELQNAPFLIFANKADMSKLSANQLAEKLGMHSIKRDWYIQQSCALTGEGLYEGLDWLNTYLSKQRK